MKTFKEVLETAHAATALVGIFGPRRTSACDAAGLDDAMPGVRGFVAKGLHRWPPLPALPGWPLDSYTGATLNGGTPVASIRAHERSACASCRSATRCISAQAEC